MSASIATLRRLARFHKTNILDFFDPAESNSRLVRPTGRKVLEAGQVCAWSCWPGQHGDGAASFSHRAPGWQRESYTHEGEEFLLVLRGGTAPRTR